MKRLVIHAGFHKTGTKTVQRALGENRAALAPFTEVRLKADLEPLIERVRKYAVDPNRQNLRKVRRVTETVLAGLSPDPDRSAIISAEDLAGIMPGRRADGRYGALAAVLPAMERAAQACFGDQLELTFYFSTRGAKAWANSLWWQNLRGTRLVDDFEDFAHKVEEVTDLDGLLAQVTANLKRARLTSFPLEDSKDLPQGPLTPLLELLDIPEECRKGLVIPEAANQRPPGGLEPVFLALNRSELSDKAVSAIKQQVLQAAEREKRTLP